LRHPELEENCPNCGGSGAVKSPRGRFNPCQLCSATGLVLTKAGKQLLEFIDRRLIVASKLPGKEEEEENEGWASWSEFRQKKENNND